MSIQAHRLTEEEVTKIAKYIEGIEEEESKEIKIIAKATQSTRVEKIARHKDWIREGVRIIRKMEIASIQKNELEKILKKQV